MTEETKRLSLSKTEIERGKESFIMPSSVHSETSSLGQAYKKDVKPELGKYFKVLDDLQKVEAWTLLNSLMGKKGLGRPNTKDFKSREDIVKKLLQVDPEFMTEYETKKIYFHAYQREEQTFLKARLTVDDDTDYSTQKSCIGQKVNIKELIQRITEAVSSDDEEVNMDTFYANEEETVSTKDDQNQKNQMSQLCHKMVDALNDNKQKSSLAPRPKKIRYDEDEGVGVFLQKIEDYALSQKITDDSAKIDLAVNCLSESRKGYDLLGFIRNSKLTNTWSLFKERTLLMVACSKEQYRKQFKTYQRKPSQTAAHLMVTLQDLYLRSKDLDGDHALSKDHIEAIRERFFDCLDPALAGMAKYTYTERTRDTTKFTELESIAKMCMDLEENFNLDRSRKEVSVLNNIIATEPEKPEPTFATELQGLKSMINSIQTELNNQKSRKPYRSQSRIFDSKKMKGYCLQFLKAGSECRKGSDCRYKHTEAPTDVLDYVKSLQK